MRAIADSPAAGCCRVVSPPEDRLSLPMVESAFVRYIVEASRRVLALCCREGWSALAYKVPHSSTDWPSQGDTGRPRCNIKAAIFAANQLAFIR